MAKNIKKDNQDLQSFLNVDAKTLARFQAIRKQTIAEAKGLLKTKKTIRALGISGSARDQFDMAGEESNSEFLLKACLKELKQLGVETELLPLRKYNIKPCKACYSTANTQCHFPCSCYPKNTLLSDDMSNIIYDKLLSADIIIFATPVNNFKISSLMALFIDRCISLDGSLAPANPKAVKDRELNIKHAQFVNRSADEAIFGSGFLRRFVGKTAGIIITGHEAGASLAISSLFLTLNNFGFIFPAWSTMYAMSSVLDLTATDKAKVTSAPYVTEAQDIARNTFIMAQKLKELPKNKWRNDPTVN
ncbi:MAG: flavodoxin family protein [Patescibacteria group bacterium]